MKTSLALGIVGVAAAAAIAGWVMTRGAGNGDRAVAAAASGTAASGPGAGPPVSVSLTTVHKRDVPVMLDATGTVTALNSVDIRPQVASTITRVHIK